MLPIYLDHAATTPLNEDVLAAMMPFLTDHFGNASSVHARGRKARHAVESAREDIASLLGVEPSEVIFTSGGTEANNLLVASAKNGLVTSHSEHDAIRGPALRLAEAGADVRFARTTETGSVDMADVARLATPGDVVSIMAVNNETGACNTPGNYPEGVVSHTDAVQAASWFDLQKLAKTVHALTLSGHKIGGPKGIGVLVARSELALEPMLLGGG